MPKDNENPYSYISYVTLHEMWSEIKSFIVVWLIFSVLSVAFGAVIDLGISTSRPIWSSLPAWAWYLICFAAIIWYMRGKKIRFSFPKLTFGLWLLVTAGVGVIFFAGANLPTWAALPIYFGVLIAFVALERLAVLGRENYLKLSNQPKDNA